MTEQWYYRGSCRYCGNVKYGPEPGRDPPGTPCGGRDCNAPAPRRLDWTLNECDPDERVVVEHGND